MASLEAVEEAVRGLLDRLAEVDPDVRRKYGVERTVSCRIRDLDTFFVARCADDGSIQDVSQADRATASGAQVKLSLTSDDLIALIDGELSVPAAWATGRLKIDASMLDLLKLRSLL